MNRAIAIGALVLAVLGCGRVGPPVRAQREASQPPAAAAPAQAAPPAPAAPPEADEETEP